MNWSKTPTTATSFITLNTNTTTAAAAATVPWQEAENDHTTFSSTSSSFSSFSSSSSSLLSDVNSWLWNTVPPVLLVSGLFGNGMTILVMRRMRGSDITASLSLYFTALAVSDLCILLSSLLWYWPKMMPHVPAAYFQDLSCTLLFFSFYTSSLTSAWFLVVMTCQRVTSVVLPHRVRTLCTVRKAKAVISAIVILAGGLNVQIFFNYHVERVDGETKRCQSVDERAAHVFLLVDLTLASMLPFLILVIGNSVLVSAAMRSARFSRALTGAKGQELTVSRCSSRVSSMTTTLVLTSVAFLLLTLPTCAMDVYLETVGYCALEVEDVDQDAKLTLMDTVCVMMWMGNSAVNFYLYVLSGSKFRQETKRYLCCCFPRW